MVKNLSLHLSFRSVRELEEWRDQYFTLTVNLVNAIDVINKQYFIFLNINLNNKGDAVREREGVEADAQIRRRNYKGKFRLGISILSWLFREPSLFKHNIMGKKISYQYC